MTDHANTLLFHNKSEKIMIFFSTATQNCRLFCQKSAKLSLFLFLVAERRNCRKLIFPNIHYTHLNTWLPCQKSAKFANFCDQLLKHELFLQVDVFLNMKYLKIGNYFIENQQNSRAIVKIWIFPTAYIF